jgi:hypothetical protein
MDQFKTLRGFIYTVVIFLLLAKPLSAEIIIPDGITGAWFNPDRDGEGFMIGIAAGGISRKIPELGGIIPGLDGSREFVVTWYTYEDGEQKWLLGSAPLSPDQTHIPVPMQEYHGADFGEAFDPNAVISMEWGTLEFSFTSCDSGTVHYQSDRGSGSIALTRLILISGLGCNETSARGGIPFLNTKEFPHLEFPFFNSENLIVIPDGITGAWFNPDRDGEGFIIGIADVEGERDFVVTWYTYEDGEQKWLLGSAPLSPDQTQIHVPMQVYQGADFGEAFDPNAVISMEWGTLEFSFTACDSGAVHYLSDRGSGSIALTRLIWIGGLVCEEERAPNLRDPFRHDPLLCAPPRVWSPEEGECKEPPENLGFSWDPVCPPRMVWSPEEGECKWPQELNRRDPEMPRLWDPSSDGWWF